MYFDLPAEQQAEFDNLRPPRGASDSAAMRFWPQGAAYYATAAVVVLAFIFPYFTGDDVPT